MIKFQALKKDERMSSSWTPDLGIFFFFCLLFIFFCRESKIEFEEKIKLGATVNDLESQCKL